MILRKLLSRILRRWAERRGSSRGTAARPRYRPQLGMLEDRVCPSSTGSPFSATAAGMEGHSPRILTGALASASKAAPTLKVTAPGGTFNGKPFPASATAAGKGGTPVKGSFTFTYYAGSKASGPGSTSAPKNAGTYKVTASFTSTDPGYSNALSGPVSFTITLALSSGKASPGQTLTLTGAVFDPTATTYVVFTDPTGKAARVRAEAVTASAVTVVVPPFLNEKTMQFGAGTVQVSVEQDATGGAVTTFPAGPLKIGALPQTGLKAGTVTLAALDQIQKAITTAEQNWLTIQKAAQGTVDTSALQTYLGGIQKQIANLRNQVQQLANGSVAKITLGQINSRGVFLDPAALQLLDQMFTAYFLGGAAPAGAQVKTLGRGPLAKPADDLATSFQNELVPSPTESLKALVERFEKINAIGKVGIGIAVLGVGALSVAALPAALAAAEVGGFLLTWGTVLAPIVVGLSALYASTPFLQDGNPPITNADMKFFFTQIGKGLTDLVVDEGLNRLGEFLHGTGLGDKTLVAFFSSWYNATFGGLHLLGYPDPKAVPTLALGNSQTIFAHLPKPAAALVVSTSALAFSFPAAGPDPAPQSFTVTNTGAAGSLLHYTVAPSLFSRVHVAGEAAALPAGQQQSFSVSVDAAGLKPGTYQDALTITNTDTNASQSIAVTYTIAAPNPYAGSYVGSYSGSGTAFGMTNLVGGPVAFTVDANGVITITAPGGGLGSVNIAGQAKFAGAGGFGSVGDAGYSFGGTFVVSPSGGVSAGGGWGATFEGGSGSGSWSATRG